MNNKENNHFDHIPTGPELISLYQQLEEDNPMSPYYKRVLIRPSLHPIKTLFNVLIPLILISIIGIILNYITKNIYISIFIPIIIFIIYCLIRIKSIMIWCVKCYQRFAPDSLRNRCRFEPSCSMYMIKSIEKYGPLKGAIKGFNRMKRCKPPNGGFDEP